MIRKEFFRNVFVSLDYSEHRRKPVTLLYIAHRINTLLYERRLYPVVSPSMDLRFDIKQLTVRNGELVLEYYQPDNADFDGGYFHFSNSLKLRLYNTWLNRTPPEPVQVMDIDGERISVSTERFDKRGGRSLDAAQCMDEVDIGLIVGLYKQALHEAFELLSSLDRNSDLTVQGFRVGQIIYKLDERELHSAAWKVMELVKIQDSDPSTYVRDLRLQHLLTGEYAFAHGGRFGTEQDWLKAHVAGKAALAQTSELEPTRCEREFMDYVSQHIEQADGQ